MGAQEAKVDAVNATATGDGQRLAEGLGAQIVNGDLALGPELRFIAPARETFVRRLPPWRRTRSRGPGPTTRRARDLRRPGLVVHQTPVEDNGVA